MGGAALLGQWGLKSESAWGTGVVVDKFVQAWLSGNPGRTQPPLVSKGIRAGRRLPSCMASGARTVQGTVEMELNPLPLATLQRHQFGQIATTGTNPYDHTASIGSLDGKSFTSQWGLPGTGGTVHPITAVGCKIQGWTRKATAGQIATQSLDIVAKDYVTGTALASASYGSSCPFTFVQGSVKIGGVTIGTVKSFEESVKRQFRVEHPIGSLTIMEQHEMGQAEATITVEADFEDLTLHDLANTAVAVELKFDNGTDTLTDTANCFVIPTTPTVQGIDSLTSFTFQGQCYGSSDAAGLTSVLHNTESSSA